MGKIEENTALRIYGHLQEGFTNPLYPDGLPVGYQESVVPGPATILSTIDGNGIRAYSVEIVQTARQLSPAQKSMVIRVTDPVLLEKTGGIVQGMSGSPILQNGRIVGAVTHVFVDYDRATAFTSNGCCKPPRKWVSTRHRRSMERILMGERRLRLSPPPASLRCGIAPRTGFFIRR